MKQRFGQLNQHGSEIQFRVEAERKKTSRTYLPDLEQTLL
jgi:hypothetical protein